MNLVLAICRTGSLAGAARELGVNHSTVFRRINAIEKDLNVRLFDRRPTGYVMTEAGEAVHRVASRIDEEVHGLSRALVGRDRRLEGPVRVTAPDGVTRRLLLPKLAQFCREHPGIDMHVVITSRALQLSHREADVAVRVTRRPPQGYIGRRICAFRFCAYASRDYLARRGDVPLERHQWLVTDDGFDYLPPSVLPDRASARIALKCSDTTVVLEAAKQGLGVAPLPCFLGDAEPDLVRVTPPLEPLTRELWVFTHPDLRTTARVAALMAHLVASLEEQKARIEGVSG